MKNQFVKLGLAMGVALMGVASIVRAEGDGGPLIDALVKKGVLNSQEGEEIRAEMLTDYTATPGGMLTFGSSAVKGLKLYGDARLRYEYERKQSLVGTNIASQLNVTERNRNRYRVRLGAEYLFSDNFKAGVRLATNGAGSSRNSTNADLGTGQSGWGSSQAVGVDLVYLESDKSFGQDWLSWTAGRMLQPHNIVNGWTWDSDENPDGGLIKLGDFKPFGDAFTVGSTHGIYIWTDVAQENQATSTTPASNASAADSWMFVNQVDLSYKFSPSWNLRVSPAYITSSGDSSTRTNPNAGTTYTNDINYLNVFMVDAALDTPFFLSNSKGKFYGEYGVNLTGADYADHYNSSNSLNNAYNKSGRNQFYLLGYQATGGGTKGKGKGGWSLDGTYAYFEQYSWTGALIDSDWAGLNQSGFGVKAAYNFTDNITGSVNWRRSHVIDAVVESSGTPSGPSAPLNSYDLVQIDLVWKF